MGKTTIWWLDFDGGYDLWAEKSESRICLVSTHLQRNPEDLSQVDMGGGHWVDGERCTEKTAFLIGTKGAEFDGKTSHDIMI